MFCNPKHTRFTNTNSLLVLPAYSQKNKPTGLKYLIPIPIPYFSPIYLDFMTCNK